MIVAIRITSGTVRGTIQLPNPMHATAARVMACAWRAQLGAAWTVDLLDDSGRLTH